MMIPFYNFHDLHNTEFREKASARLNDIMAKNAFVEGEYNTAFEKEFAQMQGAKHCLLVANGTDALEISMLAHDIGPGDKVGVPDITFYASAEAVINIGAEPVFIDIDPESGLICPTSLKKTLENTKLAAVMPVHIYGLPAPMKEIESICNPLGIPIIEDAAQAQGTLLEDGPVGCTNNLTTFSFYPTKNLSAFGDAGAILTQSDELREKIITIRNHGRGSAPVMGRNSRCDHMQAAILHLKLEKIEGYNKNRKQIANWYHQKLSDLPIGLLNPKFLETSSWHLYPIRLKDNEECLALQNFLKEKEIGSVSNYYAKTVSEEKVFDKYETSTPNAKNFAGRVLCLPMSPFIKENDVAKISEALREFFA